MSLGRDSQLPVYQSSCYGTPRRCVGYTVAYSPVGAVITVTQKDEVFSVENTRVHIAEKDLERIFTPFYRVDKSRNRNSGGSGLGLYITKTILDHHEIIHNMVNTENGMKFYGVSVVNGMKRGKQVSGRTENAIMI